MGNLGLSSGNINRLMMIMHVFYCISLSFRVIRANKQLWFHGTKIATPNHYTLLTVPIKTSRWYSYSRYRLCLTLYVPANALRAMLRIIYAYLRVLYITSDTRLYSCYEKWISDSSLLYCVAIVYHPKRTTYNVAAMAMYLYTIIIITYMYDLCMFIRYLVSIYTRS
jgi:hypothetical protein